MGGVRARVGNKARSSASAEWMLNNDGQTIEATESIEQRF